MSCSIVETVLISMLVIKMLEHAEAHRSTLGWVFQNFCSAEFLSDLCVDM